MLACEFVGELAGWWWCCCCCEPDGLRASRSPPMNTARWPPPAPPPLPVSATAEVESEPHRELEPPAPPLPLPAPLGPLARGDDDGDSGEPLRRRVEPLSEADVVLGARHAFSLARRTDERWPLDLWRWRWRLCCCCCLCCCFGSSAPLSASSSLLADPLELAAELVESSSSSSLVLVELELELALVEEPEVACWLLDSEELAELDWEERKL